MKARTQDPPVSIWDPGASKWVPCDNTDSIDTMIEVAQSAVELAEALEGLFPYSEVPTALLFASQEAEDLLILHKSAVS